MPGTVNATLKPPVRKIAAFGKEWGLPIATGLAGFAAGDALDIQGRIGNRLGISTVSVIGFAVDISQLSTAFIYAILALSLGIFVGRFSPLAGRALFTFFTGILTRMLMEALNITQDILVVS